MTLGVVADTHTVIWYIQSSGRLSPVALSKMDEAVNDESRQVFISAISLVEIIYLIEKNRVPASVLTRIQAELDSPDSMIALVPVDRQISDTLAHIPRNIVTDMPDRIIAATALLLNLPLVTEDTKIRSLTNIATVW